MAANYEQCDYSIQNCIPQPHLDLPSFTQASTIGAASSNHTQSKPCSSCFKKCHICSRSRAAILILAWNVIVGIIYGTADILAVAPRFDIYNTMNTSSKDGMYKVIGLLEVIAIGQIILFPIGGLLADIKYGRYKIITFSQVKIVIGLSILVIIAIANFKSSNIRNHLYDGISGVYFLLLLLGLSGFQSNAVQFGLDQLLDAPSEDLSLFLHWFVWTNNLGEMIARIIGTVFFCNKTLQEYMYSTAILLTLCVWGLLIFSCIKRHWFRCEPRTQNPYGMVYKVLKFVAKHNKPLRRSALTYCDDIIPSRMDFAKHKFGGPFTTEVVEDVKTFLRILLMLLFLSLVFYCRMSAYSLFPLYTLHLTNLVPIRHTSCTVSWLLIQSGNLTYITSFVAIPLHIIIVFPHIQKWMPRILQRFCIGTFLMTLCGCSMAILYGTAISHAQNRNVNITCLFTAEFRANHNTSQTLELPVLPLILPNILAGLALPVINITIFEFISAQSPHTMKGLLLGVFYTFRGLFTLLGCIVIYPFTATVLDKGLHASPFLECGFLFYLLNAALCLCSLCMALKCKRWYKYRQREEKPYDQTYVENYYYRYARKNDILDSDGNQTPETRINSRICPDYGTIERND